MDELDGISLALLDALQENARLPYSELGRRVRLSPPAVAERVRRLEESGVITGYRAEVAPDRVGRPITAFVRMRATGGGATAEVLGLAGEHPAVIECHHLTGDDCFLLKLSVPTVGDLEEVLVRLSTFGQTTTSIVLSSPVSYRPVVPAVEMAADQPPVAKPTAAADQSPVAKPTAAADQSPVDSSRR